jgi:predicted dehydrogenase
LSSRMCLIGAGRAGLVHAANVSRNIHGAELLAICDADSKTLNRVADEYAAPLRFSDFNEACACSQIDAVIIVTPTHLHRKIACQAASHGKHIFLEKPMAITVDECEAINESVEKAGVNLQIGFMRRFDRFFMRAKEILDSGELGRIMVIKSTGRGPGLPPPWIYDIAKSNGILAEVNSHDFDSIRWLVGADLTRVYAEAGNFKCLDAVSDWPDFYDNAVVSLRFENGTIGTIDGTCPCGYGYDARVEILCEKGVLFIGNTAEKGLTEVRIDGKVEESAVRSWRDLFKSAYLDEMRHFISSIQSKTTPRVTGIDGLKAVHAVVAANQSILSGSPVQLRELAQV